MRTLLLSCVFASTLGAAAFAQTPVVGDGAVRERLAKIGHIVVIFEENRSFDSLFGTYPGAHGIPAPGGYAPQGDRDGKPYAFLPPVIDSNLKPPGPDPRFPEHLPNAPFKIEGYVSSRQTTGDMIHAFYQEQLQINSGAMDRYVAWSNGASLVMGYWDGSESENWRLAHEYTLGDAMFHSAFGGSFLNHAFLVCSCAFHWPEAPAGMVAQIGPDGTLIKDGQVTPDGFAVNTARSVYLHAPTDTDTAKLVPPQTMPHIGDHLDAKGVSWAWYAGGFDDAMAGNPDKLFQFHHAPFSYFKDLAPGTDAQKQHLKDYKDLIADIDAGTLPQVTFYKPIGKLNLHPGYANVTDGDAHLGEIVERLKKSPGWKDTLVVVTYDENGGQWDHVAPPRRDKWGPGTRVPLLLIGDIVKRGFIDHTPYDFGSILHTIEARFGVEPLNDADANAYTFVNAIQ